MLNIFVCVKQTPYIRTNIISDIKADYFKKKHIRWIINPEDECAVEQALLIRAQIPDSKITALRVGSEQNFEALISAMAMGADESILVLADEKKLDPFMTAKALKGAIANSNSRPDLILCGNKSFDNESNQVPQILAQMLDFSCLTRIIHFSLKKNQLTLGRQIEGGKVALYKSNFPIVIACNYGLNQPRYAPLPLIKGAYQKPFFKLSLNEVGVSHSDQRLRYSNFKVVPRKKAGSVIDASNKNKIDHIVTELIKKIRADIKSFP